MDPTREYFDNVATEWDAMRRTFFGEGVRRATSTCGTQAAMTIFIASGRKGS